MLRVVSIIYTKNDKSLAYRVAYYTQHLCRIYTPSFPGVTHREAIVYISVWNYRFRTEEIDGLYVVSATNIRHFSHFVQVFFGSGIKKRDGILAIPLKNMFSVVFIDVPFSLCNRLHHTGRLR